MEMTSSLAPGSAAKALPGSLGLGLIVLASYWAIVAHAGVLAAVAGAAGLHLLRMALSQRPYSMAIIAVDVAAFAAFAWLR
ncbi:MAG: hypothetical protein JO288_08290, partial [Hyphomicrobiales bacterium]|nr:hypothetical protein [Hyphomicrobiales bacterium]